MSKVKIKISIRKQSIDFQSIYLSLLPCLNPLESRVIGITSSLSYNSRCLRLTSLDLKLIYSRSKD